MEQAEATITMEDILVAMEQTWTRIECVLEHFAPVLDGEPDAGGWTPRQLLSHRSWATGSHPCRFLFGWQSGSADRVRRELLDP